MNLDFTSEHLELRKRIRAYYEELFTPELRRAFDEEFEEMGGPVFKEIVGRMGADGWLGLGWPVEYGGQGLTALEQFIFWDETYRARAPLPVIQVNTIGPTLMQFGTEEQKRELLPPILNGELFFGIGYTEPSAGTDLASLKTSAVRDGDEYVINGQKLFTTHAHTSGWRRARTPRPRSTPASPSSWCRPTSPATRARPPTRWAASEATRPSTRTCGCRSPTGSVRRTPDGV